MLGWAFQCCSSLESLRFTRELPTRAPVSNPNTLTAHQPRLRWIVLLVVPYLGWTDFLSTPGKFTHLRMNMPLGHAADGRQQGCHILPVPHTLERNSQSTVWCRKHILIPGAVRRNGLTDPASRQLTCGAVAWLLALSCGSFIHHPAQRPWQTLFSTVRAPSTGHRPRALINRVIRL